MIDTKEIYITAINVSKSRNIHDFEIDLSLKERKHLIITGRNGSGKTSLLHDLHGTLRRKSTAHLNNNKERIDISIMNFDMFTENFRSGKFSIAYFDALRHTNFNVPRGITKITLSVHPDNSSINPHLIQYLVNMKADRSFARDDGDLEVVKSINHWFERFEFILKKIFNDDDLQFKFNREEYNFDIIQKNKIPFNLNTLSSGYSAALSIISEIILRMEAHKVKNYNMEGIVLIDELETHLHVDLQKEILPLLTYFFPRLQFIVTTHSPFILNSIENAVICDLEKRIVTNDLSGYSYDTLIESYFDSDNYSNILKMYVSEYEQLMEIENLNDTQKSRLRFLKDYLNEIPKFVADELAVKLQQIKLKEIDKRHKNDLSKEIENGSSQPLN